MFEALITPITMKELIAQGFLTPFTLVRPGHPLENDQIAARPVDAYKAEAPGRKAIVFALHTKAAREFTEQFVAEGVTAAMVWGDMPPGDRRQVLDQYKAGAITVLINCGVLTEGFDDRPTSCVILARSVGSLSLFLQMCGRGLRTTPASGKKDCILIDLHGSSWTHGSPDDDRDWSLEGDQIKKKTAEKIPERFCAVCGVLVEVDAPICPGCGIPKPELKCPDVVNARLVKFAKKIAEPPEKRAETLARWMREARGKGHKVGAAFHRYRGVYGAMPPREIVRAAEALIVSAQ